MKLLFFCPHFDPDLHAATGEVMTKLVESLTGRGHQIDVVTSLPWYRDHDVEPGWRGRPWRIEETEWGKIVRVWPFPTAKTSIVSRAIGFGGFTGLALAASVGLKRPDAVLAMSPPVFLGDAAWLMAKRWRVPMVFNTQDIFPDVAVELGAINNERVIKAAKVHERSLYRRADAVTVLSQDQAGNVSAKLPPDQQSKVEIIHNFVDTDRITVGEPENDYRRRHGLENKTVVMYSGNVGLSQSFDLVAEAAKRFAGRPDVHFVINGEGAARPSVDEWATKLTNVTVADFAPRNEVSTVLAAADLQLILLKKGLARSSTPSKLYANLAAGRPILASIDVGSEVADVLNRSGAGLAVPPEDTGSFIVALEKMLADPDDLKARGRSARSFVESWLSPDAQAAQYENLFKRLTELA